MAVYRLNRKSFERLKALVRAGTFSAKAGTAPKLEDPPNWTEYQQSFLGIKIGVPDSVAENGATNQTPHADWYAYPFGDGTEASTTTLAQIVKQAKAAGEGDIADAAAEALALAQTRETDQKAAGAACDRDIKFTAPANIRAASAGNGKKKLPTFKADAYTGVPMQLDGWDNPVIIDYDGIDFTAHDRPVLRDHDPKQPLGHTTDVAVRDGVLKAEGVISAAGKHVDEVVDSAKNEFPWQVSVGMKVLKNQFVPEGQVAQANGRTWSGPVNVARGTALREISILALGADDDTSARIAAAKRGQRGAAGKNKQGGKMKFKAWAKAHGFKTEDMDAEALKCAKAMYAASVPDGDPDDDSDDDDKGKDGKSGAADVTIRAAAGSTTVVSGDAAGNEGADASVAQNTIKEIRAAYASERKRITDLTAVLDQYRPNIEAKAFAAIEAKAIAGEYDQNKTELECIRAKRPALNAPNINTGAGSSPDGNIIAAAAARSMGVSEKAAYLGLDEKAANIAASMRGLSIHGIISAVAPRLGMQAHAGGINDDFLQDFLRADRTSHRQQLDAARSSGVIRASSGSGFSTMSLTGITENILYKAMLEAYTLQASVVPEICYERDTNDFKPYKVYRLTANGTFQPLGPAGELKAMSLQDESYQGQVKTQGVLLVLKREDIVNDDMGALMQAPQAVGEEAAQSRESTVITTLLSGTSTVAPGASVGKAANAFNFLSTGAKNYQSGAGSALGLSSLQTAQQKLLEQKNANGRPIGIMADRILIAPANEVPAFQLFNGANLLSQGFNLPSSSSGTSAAQTGSQIPNSNELRRKYRPVISPYLSSQFLGNDTQWMLCGPPTAGKAAVQVGYLRGQRTPIIRHVETDAVMLGIAYQAIYDFGVSLLDCRVVQYSAGQ